jgi:Sec-independent protein translocase protein TatA
MKKTKMSRKSRLPLSSIILHTAAAIIFLIAIASLVNNIILFNDNVKHYVEQGYTFTEVLKGLAPSQLLPGIFEPVAVYMGIAFLLFGTGLINQKVSTLIKSFAEIKPENEQDSGAMETVVQEEAAGEEIKDNTETTEISENEANKTV